MGQAGAGERTRTGSMAAGLLLAAGVLLCSTFGGGPAQGAGEGPDWPCIQRRVPHLSLGQVWSGPAPDAAAETMARSPEVQALARRLAVRRTPLEEAETLIADYAEGADATSLTALYLATFEHLNEARDRIMEGIARYARKQEDLDREIKDRRREFNRLSAAQPQDFDAIDKAEQEVEWSTRIFQDRQQSLTYVCETPVILEQRAFALGRAVAARLPEAASGAAHTSH
jgi:hypothetical protein